MGEGIGSHRRGPWRPTGGQGPASVQQGRHHRGMTHRHTRYIYYMMIENGVVPAVGSISLSQGPLFPA